MSFALGIRSKIRLRGINPDLVAVVYCAAQISFVPFMVVCGLRTLERQKVLFAAGASHTMTSRHLTGHAVDLAALIDGELCWSTPAARNIIEVMRAAATRLDVDMQCGADFNNGGTTGSKWVDLPHFQLSRQRYDDDRDTSRSMRAMDFMAAR